jgi:hypothetical protein
MDTPMEYLLNFLQDEFHGRPEVRIRRRQAAGLMRSMDLVQDYDPNTHDLHVSRGVEVRVGSREFYFPCDWVVAGEFNKVHGLAKEVREFLGDF